MSLQLVTHHLCPACGHPFYDAWESVQHLNGRHSDEVARRFLEDDER